MKIPRQVIRFIG